MVPRHSIAHYSKPSLMKSLHFGTVNCFLNRRVQCQELHIRIPVGCRNSVLSPDGAEAGVEHCDLTDGSLQACKCLLDSGADIINQVLGSEEVLNGVSLYCMLPQFWDQHLVHV